MSQDNALINKPFIRPTPCSHLFKNYVLYDNFADLIYNNRKGVAGCGFRYQDWTVQAGTWTAASGYLEKTADTVNQDISTPCRQAYGVWEYRFRLGAAGLYDCITGIINSGTSTSTGDGYLVQVSAAADPGLFRLVRRDAGVTTIIINTTWAIDTAWHDLKVTRSAANRFDFYLDGVNKGNVIDATHTTSSYFVQDFYNINCYFDDLKVYR